MDINQHTRTRLLIGVEGMEKLQCSSVVVFGLGGVGGQVVETLARAGVGRLLLVDFDRIDPTNINRQIIALHSTIGMYKTETAARRVRDINPAAIVEIANIFVDESTIGTLDFAGFDYIADAVDTTDAKLEIIKKAKAQGVRVISAMGAAGRLAARFEVADIDKTHSCPLAKKMRVLLKNHQISGVKVVFSPTPPTISQIPPQTDTTNNGKKRPLPSSPIAPPMAGLVMAAEIIADLLQPQ